MDKENKENPMREIRRRYEERHKEERKKSSKQFNTRLPTGVCDEINAFLEENELTKVQLVLEGYRSLKKQLEEQKK